VPKQDNSRQYLFQADATGVAGQFSYPFANLIPIQAASALPSDGGSGWSGVGFFRHDDVLSFRSAFTEVRGVEIDDDVYDTIAVSVVEQFNLLDVITCDRVIARLHGRYAGSRDTPAEISIVPVGSVFERLRIGDEFFERLEVAPRFFCQPEYASWTGLLRAIENQRTRALLEPLSLPAPNGKPVPLPVPGQRTNLLGFCIALGRPEPGDELGTPLLFNLPDFGTVHLGEFFCQPNSRRLIMLRAELNGERRGQVVVGDPVISGSPYPPY